MPQQDTTHTRTAKRGVDSKFSQLDKNQKILVGRLVLSIIIILACLGVSMVNFNVAVSVPLLLLLLAAVLFVPVPGSRVKNSTRI